MEDNVKLVRKPDFYLDPDTGRAECWQDTGWIPCYTHIPHEQPTVDPWELFGASDKIGAWLSAALEDEHTCDEMKSDITLWFTAIENYRRELLRHNIG